MNAVFCSQTSQQVIKPKALEQEGSIVLPFLKKLPETSQVTLQNSDRQGEQKERLRASENSAGCMHVCGSQGGMPNQWPGGFGR